MRRWLGPLTLLLVGISLALIVYIVREVTPRATPSAARAHPPSPPTVSAAISAAPRSRGAENYGVVASRNLFSPLRTDVVSSPPTAVVTAPVPKLNLYGVVLRDGAPIAYIEDPSTKHVTGFRTGDAVAGGTLELIAADHVVLTRPGGPVQVWLIDPAKARPHTPSPLSAPSQIEPRPGGAREPSMPSYPRRQPREG
jgi:hypothetical protein